MAPAPAGPTTETAKTVTQTVPTAEEAAKVPGDDGPPPGPAEVGGDEDVSGPEPDTKSAGASSAAGATETATASGVGPSAVLGQLADDANSRIKTVQADASFTNLALPERFKACPNLKKIPFVPPLSVEASPASNASRTIFPSTDNFSMGEVVPMPTLPAELILIFSVP